MKVRVSSQFKVSGTSDLDSQTDALYVALIELERSETDLTEGDVTASLGSRLVGISLVIDATSWEQAEARAREVIQHAIVMIGDQVLIAEGAGVAPTSDAPVADIQSIELIPA